MEHKKLEANSFLILFLIASVLLFFILRPFLGALVLALTLVIIFKPLHNWLLANMGGRRILTSFIMVLLILVAVIGPLALLGLQVFKEARDVYVSIDSGSGGFVEIITARTENLVQGFYPEFELDFRNYSSRALQWFTDNFGRIFSSVTILVINLLVGLLAVFYLFKDGDKVKSFIVKYSPFSKAHNKDILDKFTLTINSVVRGSLIVALAQGTMAGIGFMLFGVPNPVFWGGLAAISALIPSVGTALVITPAILFLYFSGSSTAAFGLLAWGVLAVGLIDNFLQPYLIERGIKIHPLLILLSVLGGLRLFGPIGLIAGPLVLSLFFALLNIYSTLFIGSRGRKADA